VTGCGGGSQASRSGPRTVATNPPDVVPVQVYPSVSLVAGGRSRFVRPLPLHWAVSLDVRLQRGSGVGLQIGPVGAGFASSSPTQWQHLELTPGHETLDGHPIAFRGSGASNLTIEAIQGRVQIRALLITSSDDPGALLLQRLAELHARLRLGQFPVGADLGNHLHIDSTYWTSGFWPGALWQAAAFVRGPGGATFERWALPATLVHFGQERADTHDVGFMYGESSLAAWDALCQGTRPPADLCDRLRRSVLAAAGELLALEATNRRAGTIPTTATSGQADTIIDSMMNIAILPWASRVTGNPVYARVASRHAHVVARLLVRADGSTAQAVNFDRATGRVISIGTHQGLSNETTWSRGQGWAVYGFAVAALELHDRALLRVALRAAGYVQRHLPRGAVPRWDYDAPAGAPIDVSAGVITAAGLLHLADACNALAGVCARPNQWVALARRMLSAALARAYTSPPLGFFPDQVLNEHGRGCWCNGGELIFGLTYALEALNLERVTGSPDSVAPAHRK